MSGVYTMAEVATHNTKGDAWIVVDGNVYNVSKFAAMHPGGEGVLMSLVGTDATDEFFSLHTASVLKKFARLVIGTVDASEKKASVLGDQLNPGTISQIPYAEHSSMQGGVSAHWKPTHIKFRAALRKFFDEEVTPSAETKNAMEKPPTKELYEKMGKAGVLAAMMGPGPHLKFFKLPGDVKPEEFDYFHEQIVHEEKNRLGVPGYQDGIGVGMVIGLPPVPIFGEKQLAQKVCMEVLSGKKKICLAISEPYAGSDVANIRCTAEKTPCGQFYIVNGVKKWITNGTFSDYFTTAVRTGGKGMKGLSLLLIERGPGVTTQKMKTSYSGSAGTSYIIFDNVKVPVGNLLGKENEGFKPIMFNFNHERWFIVAGVLGNLRLQLEDCMKWCNQRRVFGKPLSSQPVIRQHLAYMIANVESVQAWTDNITYQMCNMKYADQVRYLAGPIALLKLRSTRAALENCEKACQIFGGRAITRTGMGAKVERAQRAVKYGAILGGSEEIMADLGVRQAMKYFPKVGSRL